MRTNGAAISILLLLVLGAGLGVGVAAGQSNQPATSTQPVANAIHRAGAAATNPTGEVQASSSSVTRVSLSLAAVLALIVVLYWVGRKMLPRGGFGPASRAIEVLARTPISPKQKIVVVRVGRRILVVGEGGQTLTTLCEIADPDEVAVLLGQLQDGGLAGSGSFASMLSSAAERFRSADRAAEVAEEQNAELAQTHEELNGLAERVRVMAKQIGNT
jgi:flagellar biosynthetic protein FliO